MIPVHQQTALAAGTTAVKAFFESQKASLLKVLPQHISADRMLALALGAMRTAPKLRDCTVESLFGALIQCSQLGLEPNTPLGHAFLIPFENKRQGKTEVQIVFGYKGLVDLARRSGQIVSISAHEVCANDVFEFEYGLDEKLTHRPAMLKPRGEVIAFYAVIKMRDGGHVIEVMSVEEVEKIRNNSNNYKFAQDKAKTIWGAHFVVMGRKTVVRQALKWCPLSVELATAVQLDAKAEADEESQNLGAVFAGECENVDEDGVITPTPTPTPAPTPTPTYDDAAFAEKSKAWKGLIQKGRAADDLIAQLSTKITLSEQQKAEILSWENVDENP